MIYRDVPADSQLFLKEVMLPVQLFKDMAAYAYLGEAVANMKDGQMLIYYNGKYHATSTEANVVFNSESPLEALDSFTGWLDGKTLNDKG